MAVRYNILATVAVIVLSSSSPLLAGAADASKPYHQNNATIPARKLQQKRAEVSCELKVRENYQYYDIAGTSASQLRKQMKENGTKWPDGRVYAAVTSWDIRYSYDISYEGGRCSVKSVKTDVEIVYQLPRSSSPELDPDLTQLWNDYLVRLKEHEFGHKDLAVKAASEINQVLVSLQGFSSDRELDREAKRRTGEKLQRLKEMQVRYDDETRHGETQGAVLAAR